MFRLGKLLQSRRNNRLHLSLVDTFSKRKSPTRDQYVDFSLRERLNLNTRALASTHSYSPYFRRINHLCCYGTPGSTPGKGLGACFPVRYTTSASRDVGTADNIQKQKLKADPSEVTTRSSIRPIVEKAPSTGENSIRKDAVKGGIEHDLGILRETFAFREVPKEVLFLGGAGLIPYVATSACTLFLVWDVKNIQEQGAGYILDSQSALSFLEFLEPVQVGYGAVILSFLGAIHWGLEFASFGGNSPYRRYFLGILAPALAWPTVFMPYDIALLTQFLGFTGMYFADARATTLGWAPRWYTTYRFLLTFIVGACIVITLIGRGKIGDKSNITQTPVERASSTRQSHIIGVDPETSGKEYNRLVEEERDLMRKNAEKRMQEAEEQLALKEDEYKKAKEEAQRAGLKTPDQT